MTFVSKTAAGLALLALGACAGSPQVARLDRNDPNVDRGLDAHLLSEMEASLWIDPLGCQHWIIDDGLEGYLTNRLNPDGTPRCDSPDVAAGERVGNTLSLERTTTQ